MVSPFWVSSRLFSSCCWALSMLLPWNVFTTILLAGEGLRVWVLEQDRLEGAPLAWMVGLRLERLCPLPDPFPFPMPLPTPCLEKASSLARFNSICVVSGGRGKQDIEEAACRMGENRELWS